jgi:Rha family phage regulatory protein|nr:MAG TPA: regulatory protein [Caudoviricetes sp.]
MNQIEQTITSVEVAEMVEKTHANLLKDIRRYCKQLGEVNIDFSDFFKESTYCTEQKKELPCYDVTKKGCEFIAHKLTGVKGTAFTARYINRFHDMEETIKQSQAALPKKDDLFADCYISKQQLDASRGAWFRKNNWKLKIIMEQFGWTRKFLYHKILVELSDIYDLELEEKFYVQRFGYRPEYKLDLLDGSKSLARLATGYINYLLTEEGDY